MALDSSPSLGEFKDGMPSNLPDQKKRRRNARILILFIMGTNIRGAANESGKFSLDDVPSGDQSVAVAFEGYGFEVPAFVQAGQNSDLGEVKYTSTLEPEK